jgi:segregation and condensation protein A
VPSSLNVHAGQYDGPLDLLLDLIRKQQINIYDIPIAQITAQYLASIQKAMEQDIEVNAEFIYMAATLIQIKSKMLLPRDPALQELGVEEEDPRQELVNQLLEHERFKSAAEMLHQKRVVEEAVWSNPQIEQFRSDDPPGLAVTLHDLVTTFQNILERAKKRPLYEVGGEEVSVPDMIRYLRKLFSGSRKGEVVSARELFEGQKSRRAMICLFLAVLEMVKMQAVQILQKDLFGEIALGKGERFEEAFQQPVVALEEDYK